MRVVIEPKAEAHPADLYVGPSSRDGPVGFARLGAGHVKNYRRRGYLLIKKAYPPRMVGAAREALRELGRSDQPACDALYFEGSIRDLLPELATSEQGARDLGLEELALGTTLNRLPKLGSDLRSGYVRKLMGFTRPENPSLEAFAEYPPLLAFIDQLVQARPLLYQDMAMIKPPGGREKPWHQDRAFFNLSSDTRVVGVWIALDPATPENGCMRVQPGGHRAGPLTHQMRRDWQISDSQAGAFRRLAIPMQPGDCLLFDGLLPHGTPYNGTAQRRWALQYHFVPEGARQTSDAERLAVFGAKEN